MIKHALFKFKIELLFPITMVYTTADSKIFTIIVNLNLIVVTYNKLMCIRVFQFVISLD